ncbi:MAG TPA: hypothetical protein VKK79_25270, partial [Candidatus Lokiarchaeia archaeon]|nr:hypothetical protein [Candidatus Lokiarchaeia archaeon]
MLAYGKICSKNWQCCDFGGLSQHCVSVRFPSVSPLGPVAVSGVALADLFGAPVAPAQLSPAPTSLDEVTLKEVEPSAPRSGVVVFDD